MNLDKINKAIRRKYADFYIKARERYGSNNHNNSPEPSIVGQFWYFYLTKNKIEIENGRIFTPNFEFETVVIPDPHVAQFHRLESKILVLKRDLAEKILVLGMP